MKMASCGTLESNDCLITVRKDDQIVIQIDSIVLDQFGAQIEKVIQETLKKRGIQSLFVHIQDKGALDYAIIARLNTAIDRLEK
jgi:citrate lyase subunit gamma (acyl carrier protein)